MPKNPDIQNAVSGSGNSVEQTQRSFNDRMVSIVNTALKGTANVAQGGAKLAGAITAGTAEIALKTGIGFVQGAVRHITKSEDQHSQSA